MYKKKSIKKELNKKGLIILNVIDNIKWKLGVLQFHSAYMRAAPANVKVVEYAILFICFYFSQLLNLYKVK
jgi:hypothetical protein